MALERIAASKVLANSFSVIAREKWLLLILMLIVAAIFAAVMWPYLGGYAALFQSISTGGQIDPAALNQFNSISGYYFLIFIPVTLVIFALVVVWSRASVRGGEVALEGGLTALLNRTLWAFWRYICLLGWMIVLMGGFIIVMIILAMLVGAIVAGLGQTAGGFVTALVIIIYIAIYVPLLLGMSGLMVLFSISVNGEANDVRLPIHASYKGMEGNFLRASGMFLAALIAFEVIYTGGFLALVGTFSEVSLTVKVVSVFILSAFGALFYFFNISYGAIWASKVVPELESLDFKHQLKDIF